MTSVSVVMAVRGESEARLGVCLEALRNQTWPGPLEIVVADGGSAHPTRELLEARATAGDVVLIDNPGRTTARGLNAAIARASGEVIVRMDGHTEADEEYVAECVAALQRTDADCVGGAMTARGDTRFERAVAIVMASALGSGGARYRSPGREDEEVDTVYLGAWPRATFERFGVFDEEMVRNQDDELATRIRAGGGRIVLAPAIRSSYHPRPTSLGLIRQYFGYGHWKVRGWQKHPRGLRPRAAAPPLLVAMLVTASLLGVVWFWAVVFPYVMFLALAGVHIASSSGEDDLRGHVTLILLLTQLAYGVGFLAGLVRFFPRWLWGRR